MLPLQGTESQKEEKELYVKLFFNLKYECLLSQSSFIQQFFHSFKVRPLGSKHLLSAFYGANVAKSTVPIQRIWQLPKWLQIPIFLFAQPSLRFGLATVLITGWSLLLHPLNPDCMTEFGQRAFSKYETSRLEKHFHSGTWKGEAWNTKA